jgi:glutamine amidotransferase
MICIVDYGLGNTNSFLNAYKKLNINVILTNKKKDLEKAKRIILPGVGSFDFGMFQLKQYGLDALLTDLVLNKKVPILGVCLGMQLMLSKSEEGVSKGLGWINGESKSFLFDKNLCRPHMGWNNLSIFKSNKSFLKNITKDDYFYFLHSYYVNLTNEPYVEAQSFYGNNFCSILRKENIFGVQFHPEKSHNSGLVLLKNFYEMNI